MLQNDSFPRGGKKIVAVEQIKRKREDNLFRVDDYQKAKKVKVKQPKEDSSRNQAWHMSLKPQGTLSYNKIQEDMLLLSCVRHVSNLAVQIEFSGLTFGLVTINAISDTFTKNLSSCLKTGDNESYALSVRNVVKIGQLMPAKIISIKKTEKGHEVQATVNPTAINSERVHKAFKKGELVWANIVSELDHGYELTVGVENCRVFLPFKNIDKGQKYDVGEPLYCVIHKIDESNVATTLTVSAKQEHVSKIQPNDLSLNHLIPGMKVELLIEEVTPQGIRGQFFENCFGYIDETQFSKVNAATLKEGTTVDAYVLFVEPITKVTYLTLRGLGNLTEPKFELGKIVSAKILRIVPKGLYIQLGKNEIGFVTNKRLLKTLPKEKQFDIVQAVRSRYHIGKQYDCRILDYNYMEQLYICTFEKQLIKEPNFSAKDLAIGQCVKLIVDKIVPKGLIVKTGHVQGFVPNMHVSNVQYSENLKAKFSVGMHVDGRILNITTEGNVIFTLKQGLLDSEKCLSKPEDAVPKSQHVGFVVQTKISGALISFYGDIKGWISNKTLNSENSGRYVDPREYFFIGQVVSVWILGFKNDKLQLSLNAPNDTVNLEEAQKNIAVGEFLNGTVVKIHSEGLKLKVGQEKIEAFIPTNHLSNNLHLCQILQKTYQERDKINSLLCINNRNSAPIMSRRESLAYKKHSLKTYKLRQLKKNMILRCSFEENSQTGIYVSAPIKDYSEKIFIPTENICNSEESLPQFEKQQHILTKVLNVDLDLPKIDLSVLSNDSSNTSPEDVLKSFVETLEEIKHISDLYHKKSSKLTKHKIGSPVKCKIQNIDLNGTCYVTLANDTEGVIPKHLKPSNCEVGSVVEGVVLEHNFLDNLVEICALNSINQKINKLQDGVVNKSFHSSCTAKILLITKPYVIGVLNDKCCNRQLVYIPLSCMTNISDLCTDKLKVIIYRRLGNRIIGLPKKYVRSLKKKTEKQLIRRESKLKIIRKDTEDIVTDEDEGISSSSDIIIETSSVNQNEKSITNEYSKQFHNSENGSDEEAPLTSSTDKSYKETNSEPVLSGTNAFYIINDDNKFESESSSEEEENEEVKNSKKKKMSVTERREAVKKEEERIAKIEQQLIDTSISPQSAEQFDRMLLANPNSSELWLQYISMHVAATELDKARSVGRRAIETINMTLVKEKFNIWVALLNLENMYGTKESFEKLFEEAVKYNDSLEMYLSVIKVLAASGKLLEMEEKIKKLRSKEKQSTQMWLEIGRVYYSLNKFREARNIKEAALKSILDKKRQFDLLVRFAILECQLGDQENAIANFETILGMHPSKVNIWIIYVDQMVKRKNIEFARKILEKAVTQKLGVKLMKILFQKFINFETQHGTPETVEKVKNLAKGYITTLGET
ncbi:hypothetical protein Zmor_014689 [Zophobas morio]|uniref:S1 motif domain-containing protein n=1 Tax=Zophobas morio TaxID=2755281 RepID=A0AA38MGM1_9CUCU|nr:hypothetical protein Zmor_014689 [Zophobas morio]